MVQQGQILEEMKAIIYENRTRINKQGGGRSRECERGSNKFDILIWKSRKAKNGVKIIVDE